MFKSSFKYDIVVRTLVAVSVVFFLVITATLVWPKETSPTISFKDIQGLGYAQNGKFLYLATDSGIYTYGKNGFSTINTGKKHYYGFNVAANHIYTSGIELNDKREPLGILRSTDKGESFESVTLKGETNFQGLAIGYNTDAIFVFNPHENSRMSASGIHFYKDTGESWELIKGEGLDGSVVSMEAHPNDKNTLVVATSTGAYMSQDRGVTFSLLSNEEHITAIYLGASNQLVYSTSGDKTEIKKMNTKSGEVIEIPVPQSVKNAIDFIDVNPKSENELVIATSSDDVFITYDNGINWLKINK